jgi:hypothetical protein
VPVLIRGKILLVDIPGEYWNKVSQNGTQITSPRLFTFQYFSVINQRLVSPRQFAPMVVAFHYGSTPFGSLSNGLSSTTRPFRRFPHDRQANASSRLQIGQSSFLLIPINLPLARRQTTFNSLELWVLHR